MDSINTVDVSVIIPTRNRIKQLQNTLQHIINCDPRPSEILIHVDADDEITFDVIKKEYPEIKLYKSDTRRGPGGGRNILIEAASNELIASFDDDSYPVDEDYFRRLIEINELFPEVYVFDATVYLPNEKLMPDKKKGIFATSFSGGACCIKRDAFLKLKGFVPLPISYGMEEVDLSLQIFADHGKILRTEWLRVCHDTDLFRHGNPNINSYSIANIALLVYLRYPVVLWPVGIIQIYRRIKWLIYNERKNGILTGILVIPKHISIYRAYRYTLSFKTILLYLKTKKHQVAIEF